MPQLKGILTTLLLIFILKNPVYSQLLSAPYELLLLKERVTLEENINHIQNDIYPSSDEIIQNKFYRLIQFYQLPNNAQLESIERAGIELLDYIPNQAYLASFPANFDLSQLRNFNIRAISKWQKEWKTSFAVAENNYDDWARQGNWLLLSVRYPKNLSASYVKTFFEYKGITVQKAPDFMNLVHIKIHNQNLDWLLEHPLVNFVNQIPGKGTPESDRGRAMHRSNILDAQNLTGRNYDGTGISVLIRDDGALGPHIDFAGRLTDLSDDYELDLDHGDGVAGISVGAGNLDPDQRGMAAGATIFNKEYEASFLDNTLSLHQNEGVVLTNSSYSNGCNAGYTQTTETVDRQVYQNPTLLHVFSAGNRGLDDCGYGAGERWGNITGGHKQGKNVIATGNLGDNFFLQGSSSRGPAYDGRIKPDICAHGAGHFSTGPNNTYFSFGGTSAASPAVMGVTAQLYQAYRELNNGELPESALIKGILLNTANDLLEKGPDFRTGWGSINAYKAVKTLEEQRYLKDEVEPGAQKTHQIEVPANTRQVKFMLYWADPQAPSGTSKSLINDLNFKGIDPNGAETYPWILDPTPDPSTLGLAAVRGIDNLNNMEQVLIDDPQPGTYELIVEGFQLPFGTHPYHIIYEFIYDEINVTYPNGGEGFIPGAEELICWDAFETDDDFMVDYSLDGGNNWINIGTAADGRTFMEWDVPDEHGHGQVMIRVSTSTHSDTNDEFFSIANPPTNLRIDAVCPDYVRFGWDAPAQAEGYDVYKLGDKFMDSIGHTTDNFFEIPVTNPEDTMWLAVRAHGANQYLSQRTVAFKYEFFGFISCTLDENLATLGFQNSNKLQDCEAVEEALRVRIQNKGAIDQTNFNVYYQIDNGSIIQEVFTDTLSQNEFQYFEFSTPMTFAGDGDYQIKSWVDLAGDAINEDDTSRTNINVIVYTDPTQTEIEEGFSNNPFPPMDWKLKNIDNGVSWAAFNATQSDGSQGTVAFYPNQQNSIVNQKDELISFPIDLSNASFPALFFDRAYALSGNGQADRLQVELYSDCGKQFEGIIFDSDVEGLKTVDQTTESWQPTSAEDWKRKTISLADYTGKNILIKFVSTTKRNNNLFLDNVNIGEYTAAPIAAFTAADGACVATPFTIEDSSEGIVTSYEWNFGMNATPATSTEANPGPITWSQAGTYEISLTVTNSNGTDTFTKQIQVDDAPTADFTYVENEGEVTFTSTVTNASSYFWDFGDGNTSTDPNPVHIYTTQGDYDISLTVEGDNCEPITVSQSIEILLNTNVNNLVNNLGVQVIPNPNQGQFLLQIEDTDVRSIQVRLIDLLGRNILQEKLQTNPGANAFSFERSDLPSGLYFLNVKSEGVNKTIRLVIE